MGWGLNHDLKKRVLKETPTPSMIVVYHFTKKSQCICNCTLAYRLFHEQKFKRKQEKIIRFLFQS